MDQIVEFKEYRVIRGLDYSSMTNEVDFQCRRVGCCHGYRSDHNVSIDRRLQETKSQKRSFFKVLLGLVHCLQ